MRQHRIIKQSVREAIKNAILRNKAQCSHSGYLENSFFTERRQLALDVLGDKNIVLDLVGEEILTDLTTLPEECYDAVLSMPEVFDAVSKERDRQDDKWGANKPQSLPGFLVILEQELNEAKLAWAKNVTGDHAPLNEIVQIAATAVACLEKYGVSGSAIATNDIPEN